MGGVLEGDEVALVVEGFFLGLEVEGALVGDGFVGGSVEDEDGGEVFVEVVEGGDVVEEFLRVGGELVGEVEEGLEGGGEAAAGGEVEFEVGRGGEADDGAEGDFRLECGEEGEVTAGGVAEDGEACGVAVVVWGVGVEPEESGVDVVEGGGPAVLWGEAVVDGEPGDAGVVEWLVELWEVFGFVAGGPAAAVDEEDGGEGLGVVGGGVGDSGVEGEGGVVGVCVFDVGFGFGEEWVGEEEEGGEGEEDAVGEASHGFELC